MGYRALTDAMNGSWLPATVHFPFEQPSDLSAYRRYFACNLEFGSRFSGFSFPASDLDQPNPLADEVMAQHAESLLNLVASPPESMPDGVKHAIMLLLPAGKGTLEEVARNLGTQPRTLQRRLARHGEPFAKLLTDTRRCLATHYLANPACTVSEVASLTGYSSASAFSRWFDRQFGTSPARWRRAGR
jgi:AraC-like DNA-binding protein